MILTLKFDLLLKNFNVGCYLVMVAARRASLSSGCYLVMVAARCRIEFWPRWISTLGVLIQRAVLRIQRIFHVELQPPETGGHCITTPPTDKIWTPRWIVTPGLDSTWIKTPGLNSTLHFDPSHDSALNCDPGLGSQFIVEFWHEVIIQCGILTWGHNSTWNFDPGS